MFVHHRTAWTCIACQHALERGAPPECRIWQIMHDGGVMILVILAITSLIAGSKVPLAWLAYAWLALGGFATAFVLGDVLRTRRARQIWLAAINSEVCPSCGAVGRWRLDSERGIT